MLPLSASMDFSLGAELLIALVLGVGFGYELERAGFGSARKLTAVFYLYDMAVVKVMFSAVVTTMTGLWLLSTLGLLDRRGVDDQRLGERRLDSKYQQGAGGEAYETKVHE